VKTHITGVLSHGHRKAFYIVDLHETPHDSNLTMTILGYVLNRIAKVVNIIKFLYYIVIINKKF